MYTLDRNPHYPRKYCLQPTIPDRANNDRTNRKSPGALTTPHRRFKTMRIIHRINRKTPGALTTPIATQCRPIPITKPHFRVMYLCSFDRKSFW